MHLILKEEAYEVIGRCMEVHRNLGNGFSEIVYKDALEYELREEKIQFEREKEFKVYYKDIILPHYFYADFVVFGSIILEVKSVSQLTKSHYAQVINYLAVSNLPLGLLVNFNEDSLIYTFRAIMNPTSVLTGL
ncbi:GxxExxY protein [Fluviicola sp.]|jgi:GxxExxY protein|uniref:GxxExxY protein n=1 Tax=Fluviicola sp. TaxID=1917219 RepID=UPI0028373B38|nr:GxxExxY protein [Fluviicola sp.]MDR0801444.1 GxxExxY protein [Fluviicola sp.]